MTRDNMPHRMGSLKNCPDMPAPMLSCDREKDKRVLAMAYIEWQKWRNIYPADVGFERGTIFEELDLPWIGEEAACDV